jgi:hypothetical protein
MCLLMESFDLIFLAGQPLLTRILVLEVENRNDIVWTTANLLAYIKLSFFWQVLSLH